MFFATPWDQFSFLEKARAAVHPFDSTASQDQEVYSNIFEMLVEGYDAVELKRAKAVSFYEDYLARSRTLECKLHKSLPPESERVLHSKNILVFQKMLRDAGYHDPSLVRRLTSGFRITEQLDDVSEFDLLDKNKVKCPSISMEELQKSAKWSVRALLGSIRASDDSEVDIAVYNHTLQEVANGWIVGPLTVAQLTERFGSGWIASRRFGVRQGKKIRPIDNLSEFLVNATVGTSRKVPVQGIDAILSLVKCLAAAVTDDREVSLPGCPAGVLHSSWTVAEASNIVGRTLDLESAYKNLIVDNADRKYAVIAVFNPATGAAELFSSVSLPFGATGAVHAFNRVSVPIRRILVRLFRLNLTSFFDDYTQLEFFKLSSSADLTILKVLEILDGAIQYQNSSPSPRSLTH